MLTKIYICPSDKKNACSWEGPSDDILQHFTEEHEDLLAFTNSLSLNLEVSSENRLLFFDEEIYLLQTKISDENLYIFLRYLGPAKIAAKISFDIDIESNNEKLDKSKILVKEGYFSIGLVSIQEKFGDINSLDCKLVISGDFKSNSSDDGVFLEYELGFEKDATIAKPDKHFEETRNIENATELDANEVELIDTTNNESSPSLERLPSYIGSDDRSSSSEKFCDSDNNVDSSFVHLRLKRNKSVESNRQSTENLSTLFEEGPPRDHTNLIRSKTIGSDDAKKRNPARRTPSSLSLGSIRENDVDLELRCFNCNHHLAHPIFLCETFHNICVNCYRSDDLCKLCGEKITADRNLELEVKCQNYLYSCINKKNGCPKKLVYLDIQDHEISCNFCVYVCPIEECGHKGAYKNMCTHLNLIHSSVKVVDSFIAVFQKHTEVFLTNATMGIFYCFTKVLDDRVVWKAKFCGPKERKFFCELKFKGKTFKYPVLLARYDDCYVKEILVSDLKEQKLKSKNSILTIAR